MPKSMMIKKDRRIRQKRRNLLIIENISNLILASIIHTTITNAKEYHDTQHKIVSFCFITLYPQKAYE